jgi:hypothetical protein
MIIEYKDYKIVPSTNSAGFDLIRKVERTKKDTTETYEGEDVLGYDMKIETIISTIIAIEMKKNVKTVSLQEFLTEYKSQKQELMNYVKL